METELQKLLAEMENVRRGKNGCWKETGRKGRVRKKGVRKRDC